MRSFKWDTLILLLFITVLSACNTPRSQQGISREARHHRGHAHNDYEHTRPLLDALANGFTNVEADIHLVDGTLLVAHDADEVRPDRTLQSLYLDPLRARVQAHGGRVLPGADSFILLIDIKTNAVGTYRALESVLSQYRDILTTYQGTSRSPGAVTVILSGNRPTSIVYRQHERLVAIDGRLPDIDLNQLPKTVMPLISDNWTNHFQWEGEGPVPASDQLKLNAVVEEAHRQGRMIRFWGNPDVPAFWQFAKENGIDLINTDDLPGLNAHFRN